MKHRILAINPGSTSTKIAVYDDGNLLFKQSIEHSREELERFPHLLDQYGWRKGLIEQALRRQGIDLMSLSAVIGRGGIISPVESGVYEVNDELRHDLENARMQHASNLGGLIARDIADEIGVKSFIADPVVVDEMIPYARISGVPELPRESIFHALNQKAIARRFSKESNKKYEDLNLIVCHMGGGITISAHRKGRVIDTTNALDGCGPFSPERSGSLPPGPLVKLCFSGKYTEKELLRDAGIDDGDLHAMLILRAMVYTVAKEIGAMSTALKGDVDAILLTGGMAHSQRITDFVAEHVEFIAPIYVYPGEDELLTLAENALAAITGEREVKVYHSTEREDPSAINDRRRPSKLRDILLAAITPTMRPVPSFSTLRQYLHIRFKR